jgi:hypothetical protein
VSNVRDVFPIAVSRVPLLIDPSGIFTTRCSDGCGRRCLIKNHLHILILRAPDGVLAYPWCCAIDRFRLYDRWRRHGHPIGLTFPFTDLVLVLVAALLSVVVTTRNGAAMVGLVFLSPLPLDDVLEESVSQDVFRPRRIPLLDFGREACFGVRRG